MNLPQLTDTHAFQAYLLTQMAAGTQGKLLPANGETRQVRPPLYSDVPIRETRLNRHNKSPNAGTQESPTVKDGMEWGDARVVRNGMGAGGIRSMQEGGRAVRGREF